MSLSPVLLCANSKHMPFIARKAVCPSVSTTDLATFVGPDWPQDRGVHFIPVKEVYPDGYKDVTHLAMIEGEYMPNGYVYFFDGEAIKNYSALLFFNAKTQEYRAMDDETMTNEIIDFVNYHQGIWYAEYQELQRKYKGHYGSSV